MITRFVVMNRVYILALLGVSLLTFPAVAQNGANDGNAVTQSPEKRVFKALGLSLIHI